MIKQRIYTIDIARAISIILVVAGHFNPENSPLGWQVFYYVLHTFRMPLFLAVSGYTYLYLQREREDKRRSYGTFVANKFQRLIIPYFFISVIVITIKLLVGNADAAENPVTWMSFVEMIYYPAAAPFVWFVYVLFMVFLIIPFFNTTKKLAALFVAALILHFAPIDLPEKFFFVNYFNKMLVFFVTGCLFYELRHVRNAIMNTHFLIFTASFILFYLLTNHLASTVCHFIASLCGVVMIIKMAKYISGKDKMQQILLSVAACSYTIYLFHTTFMGFAKAACTKLALHTYIGDMASFAIMAIIVISSGVIAPMVLHHIIVRKSKILSYLIGAKYQKKSTSSESSL